MISPSRRPHSSASRSSRDLARLVSIKLGIKDRGALENAFERRNKFFGNLGTVRQLEERLEQLTEKKPNVDFDLVLKDAPEAQVDALLLMLTRPSLKEMVWENAAASREQLTQKGVDPIKFWNQHDPQSIHDMVRDCQIHLGQQFIDTNLNPALVERTGHSWKEFENSPELRNIYGDEIASSLVGVPEKRKGAFAKGSAKRTFAEKTLGSLGAEKDIQFEFTSRDLKSFMGGNLG